MNTRAFITILSLVGLCVGCGPTQSDGGSDGDGADASSDDQTDAWRPPVAVDAADTCQKMDILFVVDNSGSMSQEQANLAQNFPLFINVLDDIGLDYRVGITTTGKDYSYDILGIPSSQSGGDNGELLQRCDMSARWVSSTDPTPADTFACAAEVGTSGPSDEMPLSVIKMAFDDRISDGTNTGFLRDDALLAIVILTDENDCSYEQSVSLGFLDSLCDSQMEPVSTYVDFLDALTGDRARWATAVIAGPNDCDSEFGNADEATRLLEFVSLTGQNAVFSSICEGDLTIGLQDALETFDLACQSFPPIE